MLARHYIPNVVKVNLQSDNGIVGLGSITDEQTVHPDLINAGKETVTVQHSASYFISDASSAMIRGESLNTL